MATTPNMALTTWTSLTDYFNHTQLSDNFDAIDGHDHTTGKGVQIPAGGIAPLAIASANLQDASVTAAKLAPSAIGTATVSDLSITTGKLAANAVTFDKIGQLPAVRVYNSAAVSIPTAALTAVTFNTTRFESPSTMWDAGAATRLVAPTTGVYLITGHVHWASSAAGTYRELSIRHNATNRIAITQRAPSTVVRGQTVSAVFRLTVGDYVELVARQDSGGALNLEVLESASPEFSMTWLTL